MCQNKNLNETNEDIPKIALHVITLITPRRNRDHVLGDLEEHFDKERKDQGVKFARRNYNFRVAKSTTGFALQRIRDIVVIKKLISIIFD